MDHTTPSTWLYWIDKTPADKAIMAEITRAVMGNHLFLDEVRDLEMDWGVYAKRMRNVVKAERAFLDAGGVFGRWIEVEPGLGYFQETHGSEPAREPIQVYQDPDTGDKYVLESDMARARAIKPEWHSLLAAFIDAQTFLRLEALRLLDAMSAARLAKAEKAARKAAEAAEKAAIKAAKAAEAEAERLAKAAKDAG